MKKEKKNSTILPYSVARFEADRPTKWPNEKPRKTRVEKCRIPHAGEIEKFCYCVPTSERIENRKVFPLRYISTATSGRRVRGGDARRVASNKGKGLFRQAFPPCSQRTTPPSSRSANHAVGRVSDESGGRETDRAPVYRGRTSRHHVHHSHTYRSDRIDRDRDRVANESVRMISSRVPWIVLDRRSGWWCD